MVNYSYLIGHTNAEKAVIDWAHMNASALRGDSRIETAYNLPPEQRPKTLADLAPVWNATAFFGYFDNAFVEAISELSTHLTGSDSAPRLFFRHDFNNDVICIEFIPGTPNVNCGVGDAMDADWRLDPIQFYT